MLIITILPITWANKHNYLFCLYSSKNLELESDVVEQLNSIQVFGLVLIPL